jgi:tetratricopeptide (TPR) repeat protein
LKRYDQAAEAYKQAIRLEFDYPEAHLNLGAAYNQMGRYEEAIDSYKRALLLKPCARRSFEPGDDLSANGKQRIGDRGVQDPERIG